MADGGSDGGFDGDSNKFDDYYPHDNYNEFNDEPGGGGSGGSSGGGMQQNNQNNPPFRGRGGGPWRSPGGGGRGGRGHFDGNFGSRGGGGGGGMQPRFRGGGGGRGGFGMGSPRGGPSGPRGGPGPGFMNRGRFRGPGPGHHDMGGGGWNNNGPPHGGMGGPPGPGGPPANPDENVWAEARSPDGKIYFYHTKTRETTWDRPEGPNVRIVRHDEWSSGMMKQQNQDNAGGFPGGPKGGPMDPQQPHHGQPPGGNFPNQGPMMGGPPGPSGPGPQGPPFNLQVPPPGHGQGPPPNQVPGMPPGPGMQGPPPQMQGPPPGVGPNQPPIRPMLNPNGPPGQGGPGPDGKPMPMFPTSGPPGQFRPGGPIPGLGLGHGHGPGHGPGPGPGPVSRFPGVPGESGNSQVPPGEEIPIKVPEGPGQGHGVGVPGAPGPMPVVPMGGPGGPGPGPVPVPISGHGGVMHPPGAMPFGPFGGGVGPMGPPPFGLPPPVYPPSFPMAPPPWGLPPGVPPPTGVPPPAIQFEHLAFSQVDPKIVAKAYEWTEHASPDGKVYFFNAKTQQSVWEKPTALIEFEAAKLVAQQRLGSAPPAATTAVSAAKEKPLEKVESNTESKVKETKREKKSSVGEKCRPISSTPVSGTPWCVVWTGDKRVFFYNPSNKTSVWEKPQELIGRYDVEELLKACPESSKNAGKVKKAEATSTTSPLSDADKLALEGQGLRESGAGGKGGADHHSTSSSLPTAAVVPVVTAPLIKIDVNLKERKLSTSSSVTAMDDESSNEEGKDGPPAKRSKREDREDKMRTSSDSRGGSGADVEIIEDDQDVILMKDTKESGKYGGDAGDGDDEDGVNRGASEKVKIETKDGFKEMTALEAEVKAARERAIVPIDVRMTKFREMLIEKQVSAFSTWEKELHKIVFDPRYLYLTSKERKTAFDVYVKERAEEERKEKKKMLKQVKEQFVKFLENCHVSQKMTYSEFSQKYGRDDRFRNVEKAREREQYFTDYIQDLKKRDKEERASRKEKGREDLVHLLKDRIKDYHLKWPEVKKKLDIDKDPRFDVLETEEKEDIFKSFQKKLKGEIKAKEKKKKKEKKERDREKKRKEKEKSQTKEAIDSSNPLGLDNIESNEEDHDVHDKHEGRHDKDDDLDADDKSSDGKVEDVSEEEEGCITDDSDDDQRMEREKKERAEVSLREREREVQRTLATHLRDRDKEREFYQHEEAVQEFQALLTDLVRNVDMTWKEAKKLIKKDRRWDSVSILSRDEMEDLFNQHGDSISRKKKARFRELLDESRVKLNTTWKEIRKRIKEDPRYTKFSTSERKCEREFELYLKDMSSTMKADFRDLLKETKMLTYKTKQTLRETPHMMKDIESLLAKDKRYLQLDGMSDERHRLLLEYLDDMERKGPPPPPTASEPSRRLKA